MIDLISQATNYILMKLVIILLILITTTLSANTRNIVISNKKPLYIVNVSHCSYVPIKKKKYTAIQTQLLCICDSVLASINIGNPVVYLIFEGWTVGPVMGYESYDREFYIKLRKRITKRR